jgi:hypothetical protein
VHLPNGRPIHLHSRYDPAAEARQQAARAELAGRDVCFVFGLGLGYHVQALFDAMPPHARLFVFEPDRQVLQSCLWSRDLSAAIASKRVSIVHGIDKAGVFALLQPHLASIHCGVATFEHGPSVQRRPEAFAELKQWCDEFLAFAKTTVNTVLFNSKRTVENVTRNLPWYAAAPGLERLRDCHRNEPAIIVSAGPSLRKNKHLLAQAKGKAAIIAVQTTLQPLLEIGVEPDFVTSLDYHDISTRFFEKLPKTLKTELVAEVKATSLIFDMHPGPLTLAGNDFAESLLADPHRARKPMLPGAATVAHLSYYLAEFMGCDPVIFVGQDLGFSDGLYYTPGTGIDDVWRPELGRFCTSEMKHWEQIVRDRPILRRVMDHRGVPTYTEERLFTYLQQFERDFAASDRRIIDATEGGVLKRGSTPMPLAEALGRFCANPLTERPAHAGFAWSKVEACLSAVNRRREEAVRIESISEQTLPLLEEISAHIGDPARVNAAIARIDPLRREIVTLDSTYGLVVQLAQNNELKRFKTDRAIDAEKLEGRDRQRRQVRRDIENVRGVVEAAREFVAMMDEALVRLREFMNRSPRTTKVTPATEGRKKGRAA